MTERPDPDLYVLYDREARDIIAAVPFVDVTAEELRRWMERLPADEQEWSIPVFALTDGTDAVLVGVLEGRFVMYWNKDIQVFDELRSDEDMPPLPDQLSDWRPYEHGLRAAYDRLRWTLHGDT